MRKYLLVGFALLLTTPCLAQSYAARDDFGARLDVSCSAAPTKTAATISQTGTTQTVVLTNATITQASAPDPNTLYHVVISSPANSYDISIGEQTGISGTGTGADWTFANNNTDNGGNINIGGINTATSTITITVPYSATVTNASGFVIFGGWYLDTQTVPLYGNRKVLCSPMEGHALPMATVVSDGCPSNKAGGGFVCSISAETPTGASATSGVVTLAGLPTTTQPGYTASHFTPGESVTTSGFLPSAFNFTTQVQSVPSPSSITLNCASCSGTPTTIGTVGPLGFGVGGKYGSTCTAVQDQNIRLTKDIGALGWGEDTDATANPGGSCPNSDLAPVLADSTTITLSTQIADNHDGYAAQAVKAVNAGLDNHFPTRNFSSGLGNLVDFYDSNYLTFALNRWIPSGSHPLGQNFLLISHDADDSDYTAVTRYNWLFHTVPLDKNFDDPAFVVALASPHQSYGNLSLVFSQQKPYFYTDTHVNAKTLSASAPTGCYAKVAGTTQGGNPIGPTQPFCSWPDWLRNKYGTIANLNTAWSTTIFGCTNGNSAFGSCETTVTGETVTLAGGNYTFANTNMSPGTVQLIETPNFVGAPAVVIASDCAQAFSSNCGGAAGTAQIKSLPPCTQFYSIRVQTGLACTDTNSNVEYVKTGAAVAGSAPPTGGWTATCGTNATQAWGSTTTYCIGPAITTTGVLTYATGAMTGITIAALPAGETFTGSYTWGGWDTTHPNGLGIEDEDGSDTAVFGTDPCWVISPPQWASGLNITAYDDKSVLFDPVSNTWQIPTSSGTTSGSKPTFSANLGTSATNGTDGITWVSNGQPTYKDEVSQSINANPRLGLDLNDWLTNLAGEYFSKFHTFMHDTATGTLNLGPNFLWSNFGAPVDENAIGIASNYFDMGFGGTFPSSTTADANIPVKQAYLSTWLTIPIGVEWFDASATNWQYTCTVSNSLACFSDPVARANGFYTQVNNDLTYQNPITGRFPYIIVTYWTDHALTTALGNEFIDNQDNLIDGHENVASSVACSGSLSALTCGSEIATSPWVGLDTMNGSQGFKAAFQLPWLLPTTGTGIVARQPGLDFRYPLLF